jgi:diguanylate cyclase (GGDEF)-like protein
MEIFAVVVAALIFFIAYGTRDTARSLRIVALGCAFLAAALFDVFHFLSYEGMPDFVNDNNWNKAILFWLSGRFAVAIGLPLYILLAESRIPRAHWARWILTATVVLVACVTYLILYAPDTFPVMFVAGQGLGMAKIVIEWLIFVIFVGTAIILYLRRHRVVNCNVSNLIIALLLMAVSELFFSIYVQVSNTANLLGHVYKVAGYYYLYRAIFAEAVRRPFQQIKNMLTHDELTGLASRAAFNEQLQQTIRHARLNGKSCCVILMGLDHFKTVNATLGHERGDLLLMAVAERIRNVLPESAFISRFSGDLFSILLQDCDVKEATRQGNALLDALQQVFSLADDHLEIGASMGIVVYPEHGDTASILMRHADVSLHEAKMEGRHCQVIFSRELSDAINRRALVGSRMKNALEAGEFYLHYQPKIALASVKIDGWEALLRWQSDELGTVSPAEFIPVAEENGLILQIGEWVLRETCKQVRDWQTQGLSVGDVAINLSARQFRQNDLPEMIESILNETEIAASTISLEITESVIMDNPESAKTMLEKLTQLGINIAIDDFGTGHSSLSYLKTFSLHCLKIDRSFINDIPDDENDVAIVHSILGLGHSLGLMVVAEGVETQEQLNYLRKEQCDIIQGYFFSKPLPPDECISLMKSGVSV